MIKNLFIIITIIFLFICAGYASYVLSPSSVEQIGDTIMPADTKSTEDQTSATQNITTPAKIQPHRALYDIRLIESHNAAQIVNISGKMYFEWEETCDAWITDHRFNLIYEYSDSPAMQITSDFSTWESRDGKTFLFSSRRSRNGELYDEIRGQANIDEDGNGTVTYTLPEEVVMDLPRGTIFPMKHTFALIENINNPDSPFINAIVFDGSDEDGPVEINAFLGKEITPEIKDNDEIDQSLLSSKAHMLQMAFFPLMNNIESSSDYEVRSNFYENSVIGDMKVFYDEFSIEQNLIALKPVKQNMKAEECNN